VCVQDMIEHEQFSASGIWLVMKLWKGGRVMGVARRPACRQVDKRSRSLVCRRSTGRCCGSWCRTV